MADTADDDDDKRTVLPIPRRRRPPDAGSKRLKDRTRFRLLVACLAAGLVATVLFLAAMASTDWVRLYYPSGLRVRHGSAAAEAFVESQVSGLFRLCRLEVDNSSTTVVRSQYCSTVYRQAYIIFLARSVATGKKKKKKKKISHRH